MGAQLSAVTASVSRLHRSAPDFDRRMWRRAISVAKPECGEALSTSPRFEGKSAVVTGAGSGIGRACATLLASEGARVMVVDINEARAKEAADELRDSGAQAAPFVADVRHSHRVEAMLDEAVERHGGIDILVNNAGLLRLGLIVDTSDDEWDFVLSNNLTSVFYCSRGAARRMIARGRGGRIVNISSIHAVISEPNAGPYTAAKGGIEAFSRTLASELANHKITVNCVRPGATWTALGAAIYTDEVIAALNLRVPLKEIAQPEWIAGAVAYFASDAGRYSTGTTLDVDGGYIMDGSLPGLTY